MALVRRLVELGRAARADAEGARPGSRCGRALVGVAGLGRAAPRSCAREVADELNVAALEPLSAAGADLVDLTAKGNFRALGKRFGKQHPAGRGGDRRGRRRRAGRGAAATARATVDGRRRGRRGAARRGDRHRAPARGLVGGQRAGRDGRPRPRAHPGAGRAGLAREVVRLVQEARKSSGFDVSDRIALCWPADGETAEALREHAALVADEVLATEMREGDPVAEPLRRLDDDARPDASRVDPGLTGPATRV